MKIEVTGENRTVPYVDKKTGEQRSFVVQTAYVHIPGDKYPAKIELSPKRGESAYAPGEYVLASSSFYVDNGKLKLSPVLAVPKPGSARAVG